EVGRIEGVRALVPVAPLAIGERVDGEVEERVGLELVPLQLARRRHGAVRRGWRRSRRAKNERGGQGEDQESGHAPTLAGSPVPCHQLPGTDASAPPESISAGWLRGPRGNSMLSVLIL